jgi:hypothetical protein
VRIALSVSRDAVTITLINQQPVCTDKSSLSRSVVGEREMHDDWCAMNLANLVGD